MPIDQIKLTGFRNHAETSMSFGPGINVIWGENGSGKTSILEAVHILSVGKSFKTNRINETVKHHSDFSRIEAGFSTNEKTETISFSQSKDHRRQLKINNTTAKAREIIGKNPIVLLSPEEQKITKGTPGDRRGYFNKLYSTVSAAYFKALSVFTLTLKQRNAALKNPNQKEQFNTWDNLLAESAETIWKHRICFNSRYNKCLKTVSKMYNKNSVSVSLLTDDTQRTKDDILNEFKKREQADLRAQRTSFGPHKDDLIFLFNSTPIKLFGSQGEHKISLVLIKLAEYMFIKNETSQTPTLLLDDLFAKLDFKRSDAVLALLEKKSQTIITNTDLVDIEKHGIDLNDPNNKSFHLERQCSN
tara:strand:+ start:755 stop:1834 length:1080 start_codon:yes stop_codon:yes gene_type:complete